MPYKDADKARESNVKRQASFRARQHLKLLSGMMEGAPPQSADAKDWVREKVEIGRALIQQAKGAMAEGGEGINREIVSMIKLGVDLVNANLPLIAENDAPKPGNVEHSDRKALANPTYRAAMTSALKLKQSLQEDAS